MSERYDRFRSLVRRAAETAAGAMSSARPIASVRDAIRAVRERRANVPERMLARALLRAGTVNAASVRTREGRIEVTAELASGKAVGAALVPYEVRFAPRGAKEVLFLVDPPEAASEPTVREMTGLVASLIARALWAPLLPPSDEVEDPALVDREDDHLRVDLRTCPSIRKHLSSASGALALMMDLLVIEGFVIDENGLGIRVGVKARP